MHQCGPMLTTLIQALALSYGAGINLYATVAVLGIAERTGVIGPLPGALGAVAHLWVIVLACALALVEFGATLIPGVASVWETIHTVIRPPAAAILATSALWGSQPSLILVAALLSGSLALTTHGAKLGIRYAIDASPEPVTNGAANLTELGLVTSLAVTVWRHPVASFVVATLVVIALILIARGVWRLLRRLLS